MLSRLASSGLVLVGVAELAWMNVSLYPEVWNSSAKADPQTVVASTQSETSVAQAGLVASRRPVPRAEEQTQHVEDATDHPSAGFANAQLEASFLFAKIGSAKPSVRERRKIRHLARKLTELDPRAVEVRGHSDSQGSRADNLLLSRSRAAAVTQLLVAGGVDPQRIFTTGVGSSEPVRPFAHGRARRLNRRVEIRILKRLP